MSGEHRVLRLRTGASIQKFLRTKESGQLVSPTGFSQQLTTELPFT